MQIVPIESIPKKTEVIDLPTDETLVYRTCQDLVGLLVEKNGLGLSAVQAGVPWRLFVMQTTNHDFVFFANCEYTGLGEKAASVEGCLSILDSEGKSRYFMLDRFKKILVKGKRMVWHKYRGFSSNFSESRRLVTVLSRGNAMASSFEAEHELSSESVDRLFDGLNESDVAPGVFSYDMERIERIVEGESSPRCSVIPEAFPNDREGFKDFTGEFEGRESAIIQHEIDHQNQILISDIGKEVNIW